MQWHWSGCLAATLHILCILPCRGATHYEQPPCQADEVQGEVQGASGFVCAPRCKDNSYDCPLDMPSGASAQPQCMLQDVDRGAFCGLLCQVDSQCPSGAHCRQLKQMEVGLCMYPISFTDWARQASTRKLAIGWPSRPGGQPTAGFQIAKTYSALQSLKLKYSIDDGDVDMITLKELLSSLSPPISATATGSSTGSKPASGGSSGGSSGGIWSMLAPWEDSVQRFEGYVARGPSGFGDEIHDTIWNIEHINQHGAASAIMRGIVLFGLLYLGLGSFIKYQALGARGMDMIPHIGFWVDYPVLVNDGIIYTKMVVSNFAGTPMPSPGGSIGDSLHGGCTRSGAGSFDQL